MLVSILGCPCSGKTTTAAMAFAYLKQGGHLAEFIPEQARFYIASERVRRGLSLRDHLELNDKDQLAIMKRQLEMESVMKKACHDDTFIISDSSALNALLYMSEDFLQTQEVAHLVVKALEQYDLVVYSSPLSQFISSDPNRVHDREFSLAMDSRIPLFCATHLPSLQLDVGLSGEPPARMNQLVMAILSKHMAT